MNIIAWDAAYCLYPKATLEDRVSIINRDTGSSIITAMHKYRQRGWDLIREFSAHPDPAKSFYYFPLGIRVMGDSHTWRIRLDTSGVGLPLPISEPAYRITTDPVAASSWYVTGYRSEQRPHITNLTHHFVIVEDDNLEYAYVAHEDRVYRMLNSIRSGDEHEDLRSVFPFYRLPLATAENSLRMDREYINIFRYRYRVKGLRIQQ